MAKSAPATPPPEPPDPRRTLTLDQVLGNAPLRAFLRRAWRDGKLPQALLFSGPPGIGKTTLAWALVREIVAEGADPATDRRALKVERGVHPDVIELTGKDSRSSMILIDRIRELEDRTMTAPLEAPRKIALIEPADRMTEEAANCLLKMLEEPPRSLLFLLITPQPNRLLTTIRSRCTSLTLEPTPSADLAAWLGRRGGFNPERAKLVARLAEGRPGYAAALAQARLLDSRSEILAALAMLTAQGFAVVFGVAHRLLSAQPDLAATLGAAMTLLRDALVVRMGGAGVLNEDLKEPLAALAAGRSPVGLLGAAERLERAAAESAFFYTPAARAQFMECLTIDIGRLLRQ